jgi:putative inorganic carbon (HCO3(-)) transporter
MKNMAIEAFCDRGILYSLCALVFVLPASIALLSIFAALAISFYLLKKINRIIIDWPLKASSLNFLEKMHFIWKGFAPPQNILDRPLQFLTLAVFISVLLSQYPGLSFYAFFGKFLKGVFLYFCFIEVFIDEKRIWTFLKFFLGSAFITALSGASQHYFGVDFIKGHTFGTENSLASSRINSTFFGPNGLGAFLLPAIGLTAHLTYTAAIRRKSWGLGAVLAFFLVLLLACLCWTYSRSAWIGYLVILLVMVLMDWRKWLFAGALFLIFIFIFLPSLNSARNLTLINDNSRGVRVNSENMLYNIKPVLGNAGSGRYTFWKKAILINRTSPVWGTGLNTYARIIMRDPNRGTWWYAHNCYLQMAAETGVIGLASFLCLLFVLLRHGITNCQLIKDPWPLTFLQGSLSGLIGFLAQSFFDNTFYTVQLGVLMWLVFGLTVSVTRLTSDPQENI